MDALGRKVKTLRHALQVFDASINARAAEACGARNALTDALNQLPLEVITNVFRLAVSGLRTSARLETLGILSLICRRWRAAVVPSLWGYIDSEARPKNVKLALTRSSNSALTITYSNNIVRLAAQNRRAVQSRSQMGRCPNRHPWHKWDSSELGNSSTSDHSLGAGVETSHDDHRSLPRRSQTTSSPPPSARHNPIPHLLATFGPLPSRTAEDQKRTFDYPTILHSPNVSDTHHLDFRRGRGRHPARRSPGHNDGEPDEYQSREDGFRILRRNPSFILTPHCSKFTVTCNTSGQLGMFSNSLSADLLERIITPHIDAPKDRRHLTQVPLPAEEPILRTVGTVGPPCQVPAH